MGRPEEEHPMSSAPPATPLQAETAQRIVFRGVDWQTYQRFRDAVGDRPVRLTYDRGSLELMSPTSPHEIYKKWFGRLLDVLARLLTIRIKACGSTTFAREDLGRGLEPDECFYLHSGARVHDWSAVDLAHDPPPDLAIEIDITSSSLNRLAIYAALGVPELWRFDGETLFIYHLGANGEYEQVQRSGYFPFLPFPELVPFLHQALQTDDDIGLEDALRDWVQHCICTGQSDADGTEAHARALIGPRSGG
jgi:Uma2 family endonuclease